MSEEKKLSNLWVRNPKYLPNTENIKVGNVFRYRSEECPEKYREEGYDKFYVEILNIGVWYLDHSKDEWDYGILVKDLTTHRWILFWTPDDFRHSFLWCPDGVPKDIPLTEEEGNKEEIKSSEEKKITEN